eukprot:4583734-Amphidinium_carterae.1
MSLRSKPMSESNALRNHCPNTTRACLYCKGFKVSFAQFLPYQHVEPVWRSSVTASSVVLQQLTWQSASGCLASVKSLLVVGTVLHGSLALLGRAKRGKPHGQTVKGIWHQ